MRVWPWPQVADGIFSYDAAANEMWLSWAVNARPHLNAGVTHVVNLDTKADSQFYTASGEGYLVNSRAAAGGAQTWGVLRRLARKDRKELLTLSRVSLAGGAVKTEKVADIEGVAASMDLPAGECTQETPAGNTTVLYNFNTDDYHWWNLSAIDAATGSVLFNLDTLDLLPGQSYAFVSGFACV
jgi:hypothetical protein